MRLGLIWQLMRISLGTMFILLGLAGLFLPFLPGWLFLGLGALLLAVDLPIVNRWLCRLENRFPQLKKLNGRIRETLGVRCEKAPVSPEEDGH